MKTTSSVDLPHQSGGRGVPRWHAIQEAQREQDARTVHRVRGITTTKHMAGKWCHKSKKSGVIVEDHDRVAQRPTLAGIMYTL
jgi:hypothetical protein